MSGIKLSQNRFAALRHDPETDLPKFKKPRKKTHADSNAHSQSNNAGNKKENQSQKSSTSNHPPKPQQQKNKKKDTRKVTNQAISPHNQSSASSVPRNDSWQKKDKQLVASMFHDDMSEAIELSKQEFEKQKQTKANDKKSAAKSGKSQNNSHSGQKQDDKKQKSAKTLSLKEFHQQVENTLPLKPDGSAKSKKPPTSKPINANGSGDFFSSIDKEVTKIEHKEHKKSHQKASNGLSLATVFDDVRKKSATSERDKRINELEEEVKSWKDKFHHVKKRNQQLLVMLQQGEMKEKADLLLEVERLTMIRDELSGDITELHESLEKERSKVSKLKDEIKTSTKSKKT